MFRIDNQSRQAVYEQIVQQVEKYVLSGILVGGNKMPSVRKLSTTLNVNPNTVQRAYTELERSGVIVTAPGRGAFVSDSGGTVLREERRKEYLKKLEEVLMELKISNVDKKQILAIVDRAFEEKIPVDKEQASAFEGGNDDD